LLVADIYFADEFDTISGLGYLGAFGGQKGLEVPQKTTFSLQPAGLVVTQA